MTRTIAALLLTAALLCSLCACGPSGQKSSEASLSQEETSSQPEPDASRPSEASSQEEEQPQTPERNLGWDDAHTLKAPDRPELYGGLELPVRGATGYASVELGLWDTRPDLIPEPEPEPTPEPGLEGASSSAVQEETDQVESSASSQTGREEGEGQTGEAPASSLQPAPEQPAAQGAQPWGELPAASTSPWTEAEQPAAAADQPAPEQPASSGQSAPEPAEQAEEEPDPFRGAVAVLEPGTPFVILEEHEDWWRVRSGKGTGWVEHRYCMINLPDVIPSMIYNASNSYSSLYRTSGKEIPGITGQALYPGKTYNERLGREEYMMPVLYSMALKICKAQQAALEQGNTLVLYEGYRPYSTQKAVRDAVGKMAQEDPQVKAGVSDPPWSQTWFISNGYSNHQKGFAMDVSLAKVWETGTANCGGYTYLTITDATLYEMPTAMHELSQTAATFTAPVSVNSSTAWKSAQLAAAMNQPALGLQRYCTQAGLTPLASEWWHFNDLETRSLVSERQGTGGFEIKSCLSTAP